MSLDPREAIDALWRIESPKVVAALVRLTGDLGAAEELAQDAFVAALAQWPQSGVPRTPGAWLMTVAKRRAIDRLRREAAGAGKLLEVGRSAPAIVEPPGDIGEIEDDLLRLFFVACHPVLSAEARVALTLRLLGGLTTEEIARAFLASEAAVAQRIVRAKRTIAAAGVPFEIPSRDELGVRLKAVLEAIYLVFNEGYAPSAGDAVLRRDLCEEAMRLGRVLAQLVPEEGEAHGLVALMELQASRFPARTDRDGDPVLLLDQDRGRWDHLLIGRGLAALERAERAGGALGFYGLQAAIAACHARARIPGATDWPRIAALYDALAAVAPSPVTELNRAVAIGMAYGPAAGLELADALCAVPALQEYRLLPSVRAELLQRAGRFGEAAAEFERAASLAHNTRERALLLRRAVACAGQREGLGS